ncbi:beta-glucosidase [Fusarium sp. NRRL 52700]|nr:beta-glucosidase [Fusarium sp. NRRL 52700]
MANTDIDAIIQSLTLEEKISLLAGRNFSETVGYPEKGVPSIKTADGPNGIRSAATDLDIKSACFPAACNLAATFDLDLAEQFGKALGTEARGKQVNCMLGPTVCMHRHPLGGRNFESYSEDPFLTGKMSSKVIQGLQSLGISATIKHFVANEQETARTTVDETIDERTLREIYLRPFEIAVKEANPWAIMTAYNHVNGVHCDEHKWLLQEILRGEWGWKGLVMSDWGGTNSVAAALNAGLDLEMPGPPRLRKEDAVREALGRELTEGTINERAKSVVEWALKLKAREAESHSVALGQDTNTPELRSMIREAGARGIVLLKNQGEILPLTKEKVQKKKIALIGFAKDAMAHGGGSAAVNAYRKITPWQGLHEALGGDVEFTYARGAHRERLLPAIHPNGLCGKVVGLDGKPGFSRQLFKEGESEPVSTVGQPTSAYSPLGSQESLWRRLEIVGDFTPVETGEHYIACSGLGPTRVYVDGKIIYEQTANCTDPMGSLFLAAPEPEFRHKFEGGKTYRLKICSDPPTKIGLTILEGRSGVRVGFSLESDHDADLVGEAAEVAKAADYAIVFTGHDPQWETEGRDQDGFNLPRKGTQDALVSTVASVNPNTVVVNSTGVAIAMPWLEQVPAVVQAWFAGQECGYSIADVLTGAVNPEGRLPVSFPKSIEDCPAHGNFPGDYVDGQLKVTYAEGVFIGYRHFDRLPREKVNFPFGHGLSYTTFTYDLVNASREGDDWYVSAKVSNTGRQAGGALVQVYAGPAEQSPDHPIKTLVAFQKVRLEPSEAKLVKLLVKHRELAHFDAGLKKWLIDEGEYRFSLGLSSADIVGDIVSAVPRIGSETWIKAACLGGNPEGFEALPLPRLLWAGGTHQLIGKFTAQDVKVSTTAEDAVTEYSLSDTSSGSSKEKAFCRTCGCTLWTIPTAAKGKFYMIRLPLLDGGLNFQPANEIFVRNRPTWAEPVKDAGQWDEMRK